jgi:hypothetical protein
MSYDPSMYYDDENEVLDRIMNMALCEEDYVALLEKCENDLMVEFNKKLVWRIE